MKLSLLAHFVRFAVMFGDILAIVAVLFVFRFSFFLGICATVVLHLVNRDLGGWFFAWRSSTFKAFRSRF